MSRIGATSLGYGAVALGDVFQGLADVGAECTELNGLAGRHGGATLVGDQIDLVRRLSAGTGVAVTSIGGYNDFIQAPHGLATEVDRLLGACRIAHDLGVPVVRAMVGDVGGDATLAGTFDQVVEGFGLACARAAELGVTLGIENHGRIANDGVWLSSVVDAVGAANLGFTLDTGNFAWAGHSPAEVARDIAAVIPRVVSVHVKDVAWDGETYDHFVPAGDGGIELVSIFETLAERGYTGPIVSEYEGPGSHLDGTLASIAYLKGLRDRFLRSTDH